MSPQNREFVECYERASQGDPEAVYQLAWRYFTGQGAERNPREAACLWHELAVHAQLASAYDVAAYFAYAMCCMKGIGIVREDEEVFDRMYDAAEYGYSLAQKMLGEMISSGTGCNPDAVEACYWLSLALAQGQIDARSSLETVQKELSEDDLQRVYARSMQTLLGSVQYWSEVNRELAVIHERYPVCFDSVDLHGQAAVREKVLVTAKGEAPINLDHAEILRQKARLTIDEFAKLVGVTRMTYHTWRGGGPIRNSNRTRLETVVTGLERLFASPEWPVVEVELLTTAGKESVLRRAIEQVRQPRL